MPPPDPTPPPLAQPEFLAKPVAEMSEAEWESLCDGCGLCCQISEEDETTGLVTRTDIACQYLCLDSHTCLDYANRRRNVPDCVKATPQNIAGLTWLPDSCGYRRAAAGRPLPEWHHLVCGNRARVHTHGPSMLGRLISEAEIECDEPE